MNTKAKDYSFAHTSYAVLVGGLPRYFASRSEALSFAQMHANELNIDVAVTTIVNGKSTRAAMYIEPKGTK